MRLRHWCAVFMALLALGFLSQGAEAQQSVKPCLPVVSTASGVTVTSCQDVGPSNPLPVGASTVTWTRDSTTITTGGTSQVLIAANPTRKALFIENPCSATEDLFVDFGQAASTTLSVDIPACGNLSLGIGIVSTQSINVNAATTAHAFIAFEGN